MTTINFNQIGIIYSDYENPVGTPIQFSGAKKSHGRVEIFPEYAKGLLDLDGFSHIILLYYFHLIEKSSLIVKPFMDQSDHGIFSTRSPSRPNPIGLSIVRLNEISNNQLYIENVDIVNGTPLIDIKPYISNFDAIETERIGWLENNIHKHTYAKDDGRFLK